MVSGYFYRLTLPKANSEPGSFVSWSLKGDEFVPSDTSIYRRATFQYGLSIFQFTTCLKTEQITKSLTNRFDRASRLEHHMKHHTAFYLSTCHTWGQNLFSLECTIGFSFWKNWTLNYATIKCAHALSSDYSRISSALYSTSAIIKNTVPKPFNFQIITKRFDGWSIISQWNVTNLYGISHLARLITTTGGAASAFWKKIKHWLAAGFVPTVFCSHTLPFAIILCFCAFASVLTLFPCSSVSNRISNYVNRQNVTEKTPSPMIKNCWGTVPEI